MRSRHCVTWVTAWWEIVRTLRNGHCAILPSASDMTTQNRTLDVHGSNRGNTPRKRNMQRTDDQLQKRSICCKCISKTNLITQVRLCPTLPSACLQGLSVALLRPSMSLPRFTSIAVSDSAAKSILIVILRANPLC